ncbi:MAG: AAA family ATPase [Deltaproteobacteria bacterium]|nr:AAA family ATPase [Deltaproteobacteria bacterium]
MAEGTSGEEVNIIHSGAGIAQVLPLIVQLKIAKEMPRLFCVEQPELHLHPYAHALVAEAFIDRMKSDPESRFLIETHSDAFVLRFRRELALGNFKPEEVRCYFVDDSGEGGSNVKETKFDADGTPEWWPPDVFAEPEQEFFEIQRIIAERDARHNEVRKRGEDK